MFGGAYIGLAKLDSTDDLNCRDLRVVVIWTNSELSSVEGLLLTPVNPQREEIQLRRVGRFSENRWGTHSLSYVTEWLEGAPMEEFELI